MPSTETQDLTRLIFADDGTQEAVTFESVCYPISFRIDEASPSPIVICDCDGAELGRARSPFHAAMFVRALQTVYGQTVRSLPAPLMRELRSVRPDLVS